VCGRWLDEICQADRHFNQRKTIRSDEAFGVTPAAAAPHAKCEWGALQEVEVSSDEERTNEPKKESMAPHPSPLDNPAGNSKKKPLKSIIVMENDDDHDDSSSSDDEDLLLCSEAIHRLLLDRRGMSRAMVARLPRQEASPSAGGAHNNNNNNNSDVESHGKEENEKPVRRHHGDAKKDDSVLINAAASAPASLQALFPTGLFDSSDSDESLLTCLPIGHVEQVCRVSQQPSRALQIRGASTLIAQGSGLSSDDDEDDDSSDDGFYKRDKKVSARRRGRMTEEKREPSHGDAALDGFDEVLDAKMPATQHGQATNGVRSKTSATDVLYENERQSSDESSLLSLSEKDDESNRCVASKPKPNKEPAGKLTRDYDPQVGDRVYAQWMPDEWYWGHVSGYKRNKSARQGYYSVSSLAFFFFCVGRTPGCLLDQTYHVLII
jgi:hypothetical protein